MHYLRINRHVTCRKGILGLQQSTIRAMMEGNEKVPRDVWGSRYDYYLVIVRVFIGADGTL